MSPEMYAILGVGIGLLAVIVALFAATWQMMNSRFDAASSDTNARFDDASSNTNARFNALSSDMNARFEESNQRYLLMVEQNRQLIAEVSPTFTASGAAGRAAPTAPRNRRARRGLGKETTVQLLRALNH